LAGESETLAQLPDLAWSQQAVLRTHRSHRLLLRPFALLHRAPFVTTPVATEQHALHRRAHPTQSNVHYLGGARVTAAAAAMEVSFQERIGCHARKLAGYGRRRPRELDHDGQSSSRHMYQLA